MAVITKSEWKYKGAFVVQFRDDTDLDEGRCGGRVEHVATYEAVSFDSIEELLAFMSRMLKEARAGNEGQTLSADDS